MAAFTFDGSTYEADLNDADTAAFADHLRQGRSLAMAAIRKEAEREGDKLVGLASRGPWHLAPLMQAIGCEERKLKLSGGIAWLMCGGFATLCAAGLAEKAFRLSSKVPSPGDFVDAILMAALAGASIVTAYEISALLRTKPALRRNEAAQELFRKATDAVGVGDRAVYVGTVGLDDGGVGAAGVRLIRYDSIGRAIERDGCLRLDDRAGAPMLSIGVAGDGHDLLTIVDLIRQRIPVWGGVSAPDGGSAPRSFPGS